MCLWEHELINTNQPQPDSHESGFCGEMNTQTEPKQISVGRILINHLILWPIMHTILAFFTMGVWLLIGWMPQLIDLCYSINRRSKYAEWERVELIKAIRGGKEE